MKKKISILAFVVVGLVCQPILSVVAVGEEGMLMKANCENVVNNLKIVQREDAKARVYLGAYFEEILNDYIKPFNVALVENDLSSAKFVDNQNEFATARVTFANDFTKYQKMLEELVAMDCKNDPDKFYNELVDVRQRRKAMEQDVLKLRRLISEHIALVDGVKGKL